MPVGELLCQDLAQSLIIFDDQDRPLRSHMCTPPFDVASLDGMSFDYVTRTIEANNGQNWPISFAFS